MAFQPAPACAQTAIQYTLPGPSNAFNILHWRYTGVGSITLPALEALSIALQSALAAELPATMSNQCSITRIIAKSLENEVAPVYDYTLPAPIVGSTAAQVLPNNVTFSVKLDTGLTGRSTRGRIYHVGLTEATVTGNFLSTASANVIAGAWDDVRESVAGASDFLLAVLSRQTNGQPRLQAVTYNVQSVGWVDTRVDTQRRRLPRLFV